jgi:branched-chain amino acid transport system substrate-binding protein
MRRNPKRMLISMMVVLTLFVFSHPIYAAEYNISGFVDFTGPYAVIMPPIDDAAKATFAWWNETVGKELGVKINRVTKDSRYDPALTASLWPGILSSVKPIIHLGLGGPDVAALMKRLPQDKVPMMMSTGTYGFIWLPNQWVFQPRPTYPHEAAGFFNWVHMNVIKDRPIRIGAVSSKVSPAYVDGENGMEAFCKATPWAEFVGAEWVKVKPISMVSEVRRLAEKKPDYIWIMTNTYQSLGCIKAEKELGIHIPVVNSTHNGLAMCALAAKSYKILEGHYDTGALDPGLNPDLPAAKIYRKYIKKLGLKERWSLMTVQSMDQSLFALRACERAIKAVGADHVTGQAVYDAFYSGTFTEKEMLGMVPDHTWTKAAPFSLKDIGVKCTTVKNGKHVLVSDNWIPVPPVPKWVK